MPTQRTFWFYEDGVMRTQVDTFPKAPETPPAPPLVDLNLGVNL